MKKHKLFYAIALKVKKKCACAFGARVGGKRIMDMRCILDYLSALSVNNSREWYHANKDDFKRANVEFESILGALIFEIGKFDAGVLHNEPKDLTFKIVRDTRFSNDKSQYNPAFRAHISS